MTVLRCEKELVTPYYVG